MFRAATYDNSQNLLPFLSLGILTFHRLFWQNGSGGLINRPDFWETIAPNVQIYQDSIVSLDRKLIRLKSGEEVPTDALLLGTGWIPSLNFFDQNTLAELDLPHDPSPESAESASKWARLEKEADQKVLSTFPQLANPPAGYFKKPNPTTPYRLYNGIAPLSDAEDRSIVFIGYMLLVNWFRLAEVQSVWATAYLDGKLELPGIEEMEKEVALFVAWCRRRYLSNGEKGNHMTFEMMGYTDKLLADLGLKSHRRGWFWDWFGPGTMADLRGVGEEYVRKYGRDLVKGDDGDDGEDPNNRGN
jgi:dimethylaniline monooxygenase (N-oxide forming)